MGVKEQCDKNSLSLHTAAEYRLEIMKLIGMNGFKGITIVKLPDQSRSTRASAPLIQLPAAFPAPKRADEERKVKKKEPSKLPKGRTGKSSVKAK